MPLGSWGEYWRWSHLLLSPPIWEVLALVVCLASPPIIEYGMHKWWRDHSRTIVGLTLGPTVCLLANWKWPDGGNWFDIFTIPAGILWGFGIQGVIDNRLREVAKPED